MYTIESILDIAAENERISKSLEERYPPGSDASVEIIDNDRRGTVSTLRIYARRMQHNALRVAEYMEANGIKEAQSIGPFHPALPEVGAKVRVRAGAEVRTTHPKFRGGKILSRSQVVTVSNSFTGYIGDRNEKPVNATVQWAGSGGYWCWTSIDNVEVI